MVHNISLSLNFICVLGGSLPEWLRSPPSVYVQQLIVKASVKPWNTSQMTPEMAVKAALSRSFSTLGHLQTIKIQNDIDINYLCLRVPKSTFNQILPSNGCLVLSPTRFWNNSIDDFYQARFII
jgi:hypothetical protein